MTTLARWMMTLAAFSAGALHAQSVNGTWQGTLVAGPQKLRIVIKISTTPDDHLQAVLYSIDQGGQSVTASSVTRDGASIKIAIPQMGGNYEGRVSADGKSMAGNFSLGNMPLPLNLERATNETAWTIPDPPPPPAHMPADANPVFEVATIKPSKPDA